MILNSLMVLFLLHLLYVYEAWLLWVLFKMVCYMIQAFLISKAVMDFVIVMVFSSTLEVGMIFSAIPIFVYQGLLTVCASFLAPYFTTTMISNISFVGSVLIFAVGTNLCFHTKIKVGNLLPAVFMPLLLALFM